jgi:ATP/maltotriose-dependent transcriptional regulator MalT
MNHQNRSWFYFNAARSFANDGQVDEALRHFRKAVEDGFPRKWIEDEPAFAGLRTAKEYTETIT